MKTALISLLAATLIGFASLASGRQFDAAAFIAIAFSVGLAAWTIEQYSRTPRPLTRARPISLAVCPATRPEVTPARRLAA
jgi:methionine salvage enolase-phosphatase E1